MNIGCGKNELILPNSFFPTEGFVSQAHPLYVRALTFGQAEPFVLVSLEMTSLPDDEVTPLREAAAACAGTTAERVWITVTHTFSAPHLIPDHLLKTEKEKQNKADLRSLLLDAIRKTVKDAVENAKDALLTIRQGQSAVVCSRNIELPEGWWVGCGGTDPADKTLTLLAREEGETRALLLHLNVQSSVLDGSGAEDGKCVSGDLAGIACSELEKRFPGAVVLFLIGAAGDMAPIEKAKGYVPDGKGSYRDIDLHEQGVGLAERLGALLSEESASLLSQPAHTLTGEALTDNAAVIVPAKKMNRNLHELRPTRSCEWEPDGNNEQPIALLTIGEFAIVGVKPELTFPTDQRLKRESPYPYTLTATLVNGGAKYMASRDAYERCMYEAINSPFGPGAAERLSQSALTMLETAWALSREAQQ